MKGAARRDTVRFFSHGHEASVLTREEKEGQEAEEPTSGASLRGEAIGVRERRSRWWERERRRRRKRDGKGRRDYGREFAEGRWPGTKRGNSRRV
ncbi:hypothetical protein KM043_002128 [Ampulex compressa]|nr:hypothetical protein KM043_002128 [Ampulex compressa]